MSVTPVQPISLDSELRSKSMSTSLLDLGYSSLCCISVTPVKKKNKKNSYIACCISHRVIFSGMKQNGGHSIFDVAYSNSVPSLTLPAITVIYAESHDDALEDRFSECSPLLRVFTAYFLRVNVGIFSLSHLTFP